MKRPSHPFALWLKQVYARATEEAVVPSIEEKAEMLSNRLRKNLKKLKGWRKNHQIECFRVYDRDIPEVPLIIDLYKDRAVVFDRSRIDGSDGDPTHYCPIIAQTLHIEEKQTYLKIRQRQSGKEQYEKLGETLDFFEVTEGDAKYWVNLNDYLDTGLFLDHRVLRQRVHQMSAGKKVLNLFAYTGSFSISAIKGGAKEVWTVDMSNTYLRWARRNFTLNHIQVGPHRFEREDILTPERPDFSLEKFDLIILDPPTFSNSKKMVQPFDIQRDHMQLLDEMYALLNPGGTLFFSTNFRKFKMEWAAPMGSVNNDISHQTIPLDYRDKKIHRCYEIQNLG